MKYAIYLFAFATIFTIAACGDDEDPKPSCNLDNITYTNTIAQIITDNGCAQSGCHQAGSGLGSGSLANYEDTKEFVLKGRILGSLRRENGFAAMPRDPATGNADTPLAECDIDKIEAWIDAGTPE
jgi:hypothetical protein